MRNRKRNDLKLILIVLLLTIGLGYAFLQTDLTINGTGKINANSWNIHFDNVQVTEGSVALSTGDSIPIINSTTLTDVTYTITLKEPGDFYEFTVDVVNDGTIDAMVGLVSNKLGGVEIDNTHPLPNYLNYLVTYYDGIEIATNHFLKAGESDAFKVRLEYPRDINANDLPSTVQTLTLNFRVEYIQADSNAVTRPYAPLTTFSTDSWETIIANVQEGKTYTVGSTKEIELGNSLGTHTLRVANNTTPAECETAGFSQTACGLVIEFEDIITKRQMNPHGIGSIRTGNVGGWPECEMRPFLNSTVDTESIYNSLPTILRNAIIDTTVISGHGEASGEVNFTSKDKLYLLSIFELIGEDYSSDSLTSTQTRQLDYYRGIGTTINNRSGIRKKSGESYDVYWSRSAWVHNVYDFVSIYSSAAFGDSDADSVFGVSPAFRLAGPASNFIPPCQAFENDSWETIVSNAQTNNYSQYPIGCKKEVTLGNSLGTHNLIVANNTSPAECETTGFSQTACGFVLLFDDIITTHRMNPAYNNGAVGTGAVGGWPESDTRTYLNDVNDSTSFYNSLPAVIRNGIINTNVVSGYELQHSGGNYSSTDKIYLLDYIEMLGSDSNSTTLSSLTLSESRQLDYYAYSHITYTARQALILNYNGTPTHYWLRSAYIQAPNTFLFVTNSYGALNPYQSETVLGVYPAFRLSN